MRVRLMMAFALLVTCTTATGNTGDSPLKDKTTPVGKAMKKNILKQELWPDGTEIPAWFRDTTRVDLTGLRRYVVTWCGRDSQRYLPERIAVLQAEDTSLDRGGRRIERI